MRLLGGPVGDVPGRRVCDNVTQQRLDRNELRELPAAPAWSQSPRCRARHSFVSDHILFTSDHSFAANLHARRLPEVSMPT